MKIKHIEKIEKHQDIYCLEVNNDEHELLVVGNSGEAYRIGNCNFGLVYGISKEGFIALLRQNGSTMTDQELGKYYDKYYSSYPGVKAMIDNARKTFMYGAIIA